MIDSTLGDPLNPNTLRFVRLIGARVVFATVELHPHEDILVRFSSPPDPLCTTDESIRANIAYFEERISCVLEGQAPAETGVGEFFAVDL